MKRISVFILVILVVFWGCSKEQPKQKIDTKTTAFVIDDKVFSNNTVEQEIELFCNQYRIQKEQLKQNQKQYEITLKNILIKNLILLEAKDQGIDPSKAEVQEAYNAIVKQYGSEETFLNKIKQMKLDKKIVLSDLKLKIMSDKLLENYTKDSANVTESKMKEYYDNNPNRFEQKESVRASHILLKTDNVKNPAEKKKIYDKIVSIRKKVNQKNFAEIAKKESEGPSKNRGGDLGFFQKGQMVPAFEKKAFNMKVNEISDPIETRFGYHIIYVTDKKPTGKKTYEESKEQIKQILSNSNKGRAQKQLIMDLVVKHKVEVINPEYKSINDIINMMKPQK